MIGPPGSGKTMLARRLPTILPQMSLDEALETTKIHSVAGVLPVGESLVARRPFRAPHHTISDAGLIGGGSYPRPGEVSLAHGGVLFLDELPEFRKNVLEVLRQPMEDGVVTIARAAMSLTYPARFMLAAAMNPCPCGYFGDPQHNCVCGPLGVERYLARVSGPLLDRIDIHLEVPAVKYRALADQGGGESSEAVRERVDRARAVQRERFASRPGVYANAHMAPRDIRIFCRVSDGADALLRTAAAPPLIRQALHSPAGNPWTEMGVDLGADGALGDAGDLPLGTSAADARIKIEEAVRTLLESGGRPIALGGDHSVTYPIVRAVRWFHPQLSILHFDAHPDLYPEFEGDRYSHACPFARIMEARLADRLVQVGIRTLTAVQRVQAQRYGVEVIDMRAWVAGRRPTLREPVYVSIDLDAFDPAFAPGVSHREPGGLTVREVLTVLQGLSVPLVAADIVEFNPAADPSGMTATLCAKLVKEVAGKMT